MKTNKKKDLIFASCANVVKYLLRSCEFFPESNKFQIPQETEYTL